jgi:hypothetical protein
MGKIILIPPSVTIQSQLMGGNTNYSFGGAVSYPVVFNPTMVYNGGTATDATGLTAMVSLPTPQFTSEIYDPMKSVDEFFNLGVIKDQSAISVRKIKPPSIMFHSLHASMINGMFWDHYELEALVEPFVGDVLIQISQYSWAFGCTRSEDAPLLDDLFKHKKKHYFSTPTLLREEILEWVKEQCDEYDFFRNGRVELNQNDTFYIRNDAQAIHFKMKWYGVEPEVEEED